MKINCGQFWFGFSPGPRGGKQGERGGPPAPSPRDGRRPQLGELVQQAATFPPHPGAGKATGPQRNDAAPSGDPRRKVASKHFAPREPQALQKGPSRENPCDEKSKGAPPPFVIRPPLYCLRHPVCFAPLLPPIHPPPSSPFLATPPPPFPLFHAPDRSAGGHGVNATCRAEARSRVDARGRSETTCPLWGPEAREVASCPSRAFCGKLERILNGHPVPGGNAAGASAPNVRNEVAALKGTRVFAQYFFNCAIWAAELQLFGCYFGCWAACALECALSTP